MKIKNMFGHGDTVAPMKYCFDKDRNYEIAGMLINAGGCVNIRNNDGHTPLYLAFEQNNLALMELLVTSGANINEEINKNCETYLHAAVLKGEPYKINFLLDLGADINQKDIYGLTPLQKAVLIGNVMLIELLVSNKADMTINDNNGWSLLHCAARYGHIEVVRWLIQNGADVNSRCEKGNTPLHYAAQSGHFNIAQFLLNQGAKVDSRDNRGWTALRWAHYHRHTSVEQLIHDKRKNRKSFSHLGCTLS